MHKKHRCIFAVIIFLIHPMTGVTGVFEECMEKKISSDYNISLCLLKEHDILDKKLNSSYSNLMKILPLIGQSKLRNSQRAWLKFREYECGFASYQEDGATMFRVIFASCYLKMTQKRLSELDEYLKFYTEYPRE